MATLKDSFFRVFQSETRVVMRKFFDNRHTRIKGAVAFEMADSATVERLLGLQLLEYDGSTNEYRLDDRVERFFEEMLGSGEAVQSDWLTGIIEDLHRQIKAHQGLSDLAKGDSFLRRINRALRSCDSRAQSHLEEIKSAVDFDYRAGSDFEVKLAKLKLHLDRARGFGDGISDLDNMLRNDAFFQVQKSLELITIRSRLIQRCLQIGDALIDVYQRIEEYLNRILRDYERARKLIRLRGLMERHEHLSATNLGEVAEVADGPWFRDFRFRTLLDPTLLDRQPQLLEKVLRKAGLAHTNRTRRVEIHEDHAEEVPPVIDWQNVFENFGRQDDDLFVFLDEVRVDGRSLTEEERIVGFCAILTNEDWVEGLKECSFEMSRGDGWEYAVVKPTLVNL